MNRPDAARVPNVGDVALIFEGGGMRAALTSAVAVRLIEEGLVFPFVAGISAGATNLVNYLAGDVWRARASFTSFAADPQFGNWRTFVRGQGLFHSDYIYRRTSEEGQALPLNLDAHVLNFLTVLLEQALGAHIELSRFDLQDCEITSTVHDHHIQLAVLVALWSRVCPIQVMEHRVAVCQTSLQLLQDVSLGVLARCERFERTDIRNQMCHGHRSIKTNEVETIAHQGAVNVDIGRKNETHSTTSTGDSQNVKPTTLKPASSGLLTPAH